MIGKQYVHALIVSGGVSALLQHGRVDHLFRGPEVTVWEFVREFVKQYGKIPGEDTILAHTGEDLTASKEPAGYYLDLLQARYVEVEVKKAMKEASDLLLPANKDPHGALARFSSLVMDLALKQAGNSITDFRDAHDLLLPAYVQQYHTSGAHKLRLGWPYLDDMTGGIGPGDLVGIIGRPGKGKTASMLYAAYYGWREAQRLAEEAKANGEDPAQHLEGASRLFVSMEMVNIPIENRLSALHAHVPAEHVKLASLSTAGMKRWKDGMIELKGYGAPFWVVDGSQCPMVEDIYTLARHLRPGAIFIDSAYLLQHPKIDDVYRRVPHNVTMIKNELAPMAPTVTSWQFARPKRQGGKTMKQDGDDIAHSDSILQAASILMGLFEEDSVETMNRRRMDLLKGRNGEVGHFLINWRWNVMDFSEYNEVSVEELQYL